MKQNIVTAQDVADATGQSLEDVARTWREIGKDQERVVSEVADDAE